VNRPTWLHWPRTTGPSRLQLWRARRISVIRIEARRKRDEARAARPAKLRGDWLVRLATVLAVVAVAGVAAYVSYWHAVEVVEHHGERGIIGHLYPVLIDGIVIAASMVVLDAARHLEAAPKLAWCLLGSGIAVTLAANVSYGVMFGLSGALRASWPAFAFVGCFELLMMLVRASARRSINTPINYDSVALPNADETAPEATADEALTDPPDEPVPSPVPSATETAAEASLRETLRAGNPWSRNQLETQFRLTRAEATKLRTRVLAGSNGHAPETELSDNP